ncbi:MAG TPA: RluA family pseudouridine synthase [Chlamydiales bacterium]|nr:RluA family pseudouridine synthase [Chlamydiales bacterium]
MEFKTDSATPLLEALRKLYPDSSRRTLQNWLKSGRFSLNGKVLQKENTTLVAGDVLSSQETFRRPRVPGVPILHEDRYIIAIDKPEGLLSTPLDEEGSNKKHALGILREYYETDQIFAVHRIDRETSGVLLFARGKQSAERLGEMFEAHDLQRRYSAIIEGNLKEDSGTWECPLLELPNLNVVESIDGKLAITHFEVYRRSAKYTYINLTLETGKKHQIRAHCKRAGHPVVGDKRYGSKEDPLGRLCLHARSIEFVHPFTKKMLYIESPLHKSFQVLGGHVIHDKSKKML